MAPPTISEDAATVLKFHGSYQQDDRDLRTQMKREGKEKAYQFMVRVRIVGRQADAPPVPGHRRAGADGRQRHAPDHDPAGVPASRRGQGRPDGDDPVDQRDAAVHPGGLRRRRAQRALLPRSGPRRRPRRDAGRRRPPGARTALRGRRATRTSGSTARRSRTRPSPPAGPIQVPTAGRRPGRADLRQGVPAAQVQDGLRLARGQLHRHPRQRPRLPGDRRRTACSSATTSWSAAAWERPRAPEDVPVSGACRFATSTGPTCSRSARR